MSIYLHCYHCIQSLLMRPRIQPFADKQLSRTRSHANFCLRRGRAGRVEVRDLFHVTGSQICAGQSEAPIYVYYIYIGLLLIYRTSITILDSYLYIGLLFINRTPIYISDSPIYISDSYLHIGLLFIYQTLLFTYRTPINISDSYL